METGDLIALLVRSAVLEQAEARLFVRRGRSMSLATQRLIGSIRSLGVFIEIMSNAD